MFLLCKHSCKWHFCKLYLESNSDGLLHVLIAIAASSTSSGVASNTTDAHHFHGLVRVLRDLEVSFSIRISKSHTHMAWVVKKNFSVSPRLNSNGYHCIMLLEEYKTVLSYFYDEIQYSIGWNLRNAESRRNIWYYLSLGVPKSFNLDKIWIKD